MAPPPGVHALLYQPAAHALGLGPARGRLFPGLVAISLLLTLAGLAILVLRETITGSIFVALGSLDLAVVLTARQGARGVLSACYRHRSSLVFGHLREFLKLSGTGFADGRSFRFPLGAYQSLRIPSWAISVGILELNQGKSLVLVKGVKWENQEEALKILRALDGGLFRADEKLIEAQWV